jgi:starch synthase
LWFPVPDFSQPGVIAGVNVLLVQPDPETSNIFKCDRIYGGSYNEIEAYLYFCRASLEFLKQTNRSPNILHLHEWQTSAAALLYWDVYHQQGMPKPRVMLTIHSMANTGEVRQDEFLATGVPGEVIQT